MSDDQDPAPALEDARPGDPHPPTRMGGVLERLIVAGVGLTARSRLADSGGELTLPQWRVLTLLGLDPGGATVSQIATSLGVTVPATGRQLRRLAFRGLVLLEDDPRDRRSTRVRLTEVGWRHRSAVFAERRRRIEGALAGLPDGDDLVRQLEEIALALEAAADQPPGRRPR